MGKRLLCKLGIHHFYHLWAGYVATKWKCHDCGAERSEANI